MNITTASEQARKTFETFCEHVSEAIGHFDERKTKEFVESQVERLSYISHKTQDFAKNLDAEDIHNLAVSSIMIGAVLGAAGYSMEFSGSLEMLMHGANHLDSYSDGLRHQIKDIFAHGGNWLTVGMAILKGDIMTHGGRVGMTGLGLIATGATAMSAIHLPDLLNKISEMIPEKQVAYKAKYPISGVGFDAAPSEFRKLSRDGQMKVSRVSYENERDSFVSPKVERDAKNFDGIKMITSADINRNHKDLDAIKRRNQERREQLRSQETGSDLGSGMSPK